MRGTVKQSICFMIILMMMMTAGCSREDGREEVLEEADLSEEAASDKLPTEKDNSEAEVVVHVCGQVAVPGVYKLSKESRLFDALQAAGGLLPNAAGDSLNQAAKVADGEKIYVPSIEEAAGTAADVGADTAQAADGKVNLNTADTDELMELPGIGGAKAAAIKNYREEHGGFQSVEEIMQVEGIKEGTYEKIKELLTI